MDAKWPKVQGLDIRDIPNLISNANASAFACPHIAGQLWRDRQMSLKKVITHTLMERKLRMPQIQGVQGRSRSKLLRALGNEGDGVSSAFPEGKQNGVYFSDSIFH